MPTLIERNISYGFNESWKASKYDDWVFYRNNFQSVCDNKAIDFIAYNPENKTLWLIEIKDYRFHRHEKKITLWDEIAMKVRDTCAGLFIAKLKEHPDKDFAIVASKAKYIRVILHLEQHHKPSKLFPIAFNPVDIQVKLKSLLKTIDPHPEVVDSETAFMPWKVNLISRDKG